MDLIFTTTSLRYFFYALTVFIFLIVGNLLSLNNQATYFFFLSLFLFAHIGLNARSIKLGFISVFITAVLIITTIEASGLLSQLPTLRLLYLFIVISLCTYLGRGNLFLACFSISLFTILSMNAVTKNSINNVLIAWASYFIVQLLFVVGFKRFQFTESRQRCFYYLRELNKDIFACFFNSDYQNQIYAFEHRIHAQKRQLFTWLQKLKSLTTSNAIDCAKRIEKVTDLTLDYAQLRTRIKDPSTFELCAKELTALMASIDEVYAELIKIKPKPAVLQILADKIAEFENNYQQILQVAARDPLDFILFIQSLKMLHKQLTHIILEK